MAKKNTTPALPDSENDEIARATTARRVETMVPSFVSIYANDIQLLTTPWDIRFRMSQLEAVDHKKQEAQISVFADVRMSPQHAKKLAEVLVKQIAGYESRFGPIPMPPD